LTRNQRQWAGARERKRKRGRELALAREKEIVEAVPLTQNVRMRGLFLCVCLLERTPVWVGMFVFVDEPVPEKERDCVSSCVCAEMRENERTFERNSDR